MIGSFIKSKLSSQMTNTPEAKTQFDDLPHILHVFYGVEDVSRNAISITTLSDQNVNEIYKIGLNELAGVNISSLRLKNVYSDLYATIETDFDKLNNEEMTLNIYFNCKYSGVEYELARRLFKYFKDDYILPVSNAKLTNLYYDRYNGVDYAGVGSVLISGGEVLSDKSYQQKICISNPTGLTMKNFRILGGSDELININKVINNTFEVPAGAYKVIVFNINIEIEGG